MNQDNTTDNAGVAAVDRAISIVKVIALQSEPMTLADLSRVTGFYKSTLLRLLASLEKSSLVVRTNNGRYKIGSYAHELGRAYERNYHLLEVLDPILKHLVKQGSESASFHVYHDNEMRMCVLRENSNHSTLDSISAGDLLPLDVGAAGKLILAFKNTGLLPNQDNTIAVSIGERDPNCSAVASPVFGPDQELCGAISLSGPKERFTPVSIKRMSIMVQKAAQQATTALGGRWFRV